MIAQHRGGTIFETEPPPPPSLDHQSSDALPLLDKYTPSQHSRYTEYTGTRRLIVFVAGQRWKNRGMDGWKKKKGEFSHPGEILRPIEFFHHRRRRCACNAKVQFLTKGEREREKNKERSRNDIRSRRICKHVGNTYYWY